MDLICGINPVIEALAAGERHFDHVVVAKGVRNRRVAEALSRAGRLGVPLRFESRESLDRLAGGVNHQGVIAVVSAKRLTDLDGLLGEAKNPALVVLLDGIEDPRNLGAILRTAEAAGADGVVLPERRSAPLSDTVARASAGALEHVKIARVPNLVRALETLKERGLWVVGFDAAGSQRWDSVDMAGPLAVVLGGEGRGMRRLVREKCDHLVSLPLFGHVGSLNVSVAAGIALYEVIRQRRSEPSHVRPIPMGPVRAVRNIVGPAADDAEHDPGRAVSGPLPRDEEQESEDAPEPGPQFLIQEESAWSSSGPTMVKRREREARGGRQARRSGRPAGRGQRPGGRGPAPEAAAESPKREEGAGKGRRRRRRGTPGKRKAGAVDTRPDAAAAAAGASDEGSGDARPAGERRRRRRRRRRSG